MATTPKPISGIAGIDDGVRARTIDTLQARLSSLLDLHLTLKHVHWNVHGPNFIGVHEMLDDHVAYVREASDSSAERIVTLGGEAWGTPQRIVNERTWADYPIGKGLVADHLAELVKVYDSIIADHRAGIESTEEEPVTQDMLIEQTERLEMFRWMTGAHLEERGAKPAVPSHDPVDKG